MRYGLIKIRIWVRVRVRIRFTMNCRVFIIGEIVAGTNVIHSPNTHTSCFSLQFVDADYPYRSVTVCGQDSGEPLEIKTYGQTGLIKFASDDEDQPGDWRVFVRFQECQEFGYTVTGYGEVGGTIRDFLVVLMWTVFKGLLSYKCMLALVDLYLCIHRILLHYLIKICVIIFLNIFLQ